MTVIPIVISVLETVSEGLERRLGELEIEGQIDANQSKALLRSIKILRRVLETLGDLLLLRRQWKTTG